MSSNNNDNGAAAGVAFVGAVGIVIAMMLFALMAFAALLFTILAFFAWRRPLTLFGDTLYPEEARLFVYRGLAGAVLLPVFVAFCQIIFSLDVLWDRYLLHMIGGGYTLGSIGVEILLWQEGEASGGRARDMRIINPPESLPPQSPRALPAPKAPEPFRYASWDDEEEFK